MHVPECRDARFEDMGRRSAHHDRGAERTRLGEGAKCGAGTREDMKKLNIGVIGCGFMGRTHSNAFRSAPNFFSLPFEPVLKIVVARNADKARSFAANWAYASTETDWRRAVE